MKSIRSAAAQAAPADPTRRTLLAGASVAAALATSKAATAMPTEDPDARLRELLFRYLTLESKVEAENTPRTPEERAMIAALPTFNGVHDRDEIRRIMDIREEALSKLSYQPETLELEARLDQAIAEESAIIAEMQDLPARTLAGLGCKVEVSVIGGHLDRELVQSIMDDVGAFAAAFPTLALPPSA